MSARHFFCPGKPISQGSKSLGAQGQLYESSSKHLREWRKSVRFHALAAAGREPLREAVMVTLQFRMPRPKSHLTKAGGLRKRAPRLHTFKPDIDKLTRAVLDSLAGIIYDDDRQVIEISAEKWWETETDPAGVTVTVAEVAVPEELTRESERQALWDSLSQEGP